MSKFARGWFGRRDQRAERPTSEPPAIAWVPDEVNPWPVPVLDVRPITLDMLSTSSDPVQAQNAISFMGDDGTGFIGIKPSSKRRVDAALQYPTDGHLHDGALFIPQKMEHKWAIYLHQGRMIFIRSWLREVRAIARVDLSLDWARVTSIQGTFLTDDEAPEFSRAVLDFLVLSHALGQTHPAPIPPGSENDPRSAALWCMSAYGQLAEFATPHLFTAAPPQRPLRSHSLLHMAVARGDLATTARLLEEGMPTDLLGADGLAPLHWAVAKKDTRIADLLIDHGSEIDVRTAWRATPLMDAVEYGSLEMSSYVLEHGADVNATDGRNFTALHRAAEMGKKELVLLLLQSGATPDPIADGHTPLSLARRRSQVKIVEIFARR